ncbi:hypothetical protein HPT29_005855 [Microvirga terrae]|uniref:YtxH domain-containing protein n=1 Tax=Microvirga terrae TaxID=2740529 RepID=A0ABY5RWS5_9HYPH|nr:MULTISPECIES: hypothetical protein [Microvirga]MBQ0821139.1 hypothetical protein [Microvirga sp. HBU67558]UVF20652.1 hypothetical protein HPT29_005855 [Microvirga terrae]
MANTKNEAGKPTDKPSGAPSGTTGNVSAGTSVGNIGEAPMPHAHEQKSTQASGSAGGSQGAGQQRNQSSQQNAQGQSDSMAGKAQQAADQVRQKAEDAYEGASDWARDTYDRASGWASSTYEGQRRRVNQMGGRSARAFGNARGGVQNYVSENPMVVGLVGLAAGLLLGALLPRTRRENEMFGEWADEVRNQGLRYARDAANRGREYVEETFNGDDARFSRHESEFNGQRDANQH